MSGQIKKIIIEGPDCSGKTTLAEDFKKDYLSITEVCDRSSIITSHVYAILNGWNVNPEFKNLILNLRYEEGTVIVILLPPIDWIYSNFEERGDAINSKEQILALYCMYHQLALDQRFHILSNPRCYMEDLKSIVSMYKKK